MNVIGIALVLLGYGIYIAYRLRSFGVKAKATGSHQARLDRIRYLARFFKWICVMFFAGVICFVAVAIFMPDMVSTKDHLDEGVVVMSGPILLADFRPELHWLYPVFWLFGAAFVCRLMGFFIACLETWSVALFFQPTMSAVSATLAGGSSPAR
jgi:hypothetical protein